MRKLHAIVLSFIAFGYVAITPALLLISSLGREVNYIIRLVEVFLVIIIFPASGRNVRFINNSLVPLILFYLIYGTRLLNDILIDNIILYLHTPLYDLGYFFGLTLLPVISIALLSKADDAPLFHKSIFMLLSVANIFLLLYALMRGELAQGGAFSGRLEEKSEIEGVSVLGPIWFGIAGATLMSMLFGLYSSRRHLSRFHLVGGATLAGVCAANILFGASRGPVLALILSIVLFLFSPRNAKGRLEQFVSRHRMWAALIIGTVGVSILITSTDGNIFLFERIMDMYSDRTLGAVEARDLIYAAAWEDFLSSPILGKSYVVSFENSLAHNLILETLMSTGLIGAVFLFWAIIRAFRAIARLLNGARGAEGVSLALATICQFVAGFTSSSIGQSPELGILLALVTIVGEKNSTSQGPAALVNRPGFGGRFV